LPLSSNDLSEWAVRPDCGAVVTFCGTARSSSTTGHDILSLEYETSIELAESRIIEVVASARTRWPEIGNVAVHHRVGVVPLSEPAVVVVVSSPHRHEAFAAAQFCIDTVKRCVPMWKREVWEDGSAWSEEAQPLLRVDDV
jgi:molybdopterin synthase catalytic subunit